MIQTQPGIELTVEFTLKPNVLKAFEAILLPHLERVAAEETCITLIANRDPLNETRYMLYERWENQEEFTTVQMKRSYRIPYEEQIKPFEAAPRKVNIWKATFVQTK